MDIHPALNEYRTVTYICQYLSKSEDPCSQAVKQPIQEVFEDNMHHYDNMKAIAEAYLSNRECFTIF